MDIFHKIKKLLWWKKSLKKKLHRAPPPPSSDPSESTRHTVRLGCTLSQEKDQPPSSSSIRHENIFQRSNPETSQGKLTYQIVIERVVKRFLLYYQDSHQSLEDNKETFEFREIKQDISSIRYEISHEVDLLDETCSALIHTMKIFYQNLNDQFPIEQIKSQLDQMEKSEQF